MLTRKPTGRIRRLAARSTPLAIALGQNNFFAFFRLAVLLFFAGI